MAQNTILSFFLYKHVKPLLDGFSSQITNETHGGQHFSTVVGLLLVHYSLLNHSTLLLLYLIGKLRPGYLGGESVEK